MVATCRDVTLTPFCARDLPRPRNPRRHASRSLLPQPSTQPVTLRPERSRSALSEDQDAPSITTSSATIGQGTGGDVIVLEYSEESTAPPTRKNPAFYEVANERWPVR